MSDPTPADIRELILAVAREQEPKRPMDASLQEVALFRGVLERLGPHRGQETEQEILTQWHDLMRTGYFAWGFNLNNPHPPFFHIGFYPDFADTSEKPHHGAGGVSWHNEERSAKSSSARRSV